LLIFRDGLRDLALVQELLRGFDVFAFAIGHSLTQTQRRQRLLERIVLAPDGKRGRQKAVLAYASRQGKGKSTNAEFCVSSQLSPLDLGTGRRKPGEDAERRSEVEND
jgi:hypothetical protein